MATTTPVRRLLPDEPVRDLDHHVARGGGEALELARRMGPDAIVSEIEASGLRGRGGAGFPTGTKWRTVAANHSPKLPSTVVVNAAEGEPATFKDRILVRRDPYSVVEGALIAAVAVGADTVVVATKEKFERCVRRLHAAIDEISAAGWASGFSVDVVTGPDRYLFGEETALLEVVGGHPPFPRIAPPYREGTESSSSPATTLMAARAGVTDAAPTLVNNAETIANVCGIVREGAAWFRSVGTDDTPGTLLVTIVGATNRHGVAEVPAGTRLRDAIDDIGGGATLDRTITGAMSGVANPALFGADLDTPLAHDAMSAAGSGLGAAGFTVFDDETDLAAVAHGVSRFLSVESCGQCEPCKFDGLALTASLDALRSSAGSHDDLVVVDERLQTVANGARCYLAIQHEQTVRSLWSAGTAIFDLHADRSVPAADEVLVAPVVDIVEGRAELDRAHLDVGPDWTTDGDAATTPVNRFDVAHDERR